jgi:hypothetical protein
LAAHHAKRMATIKSFFGKCKKADCCCEAAPSCGCEAAPSCGCN